MFILRIFSGRSLPYFVVYFTKLQSDGWRTLYVFHTKCYQLRRVFNETRCDRWKSCNSVTVFSAGLPINTYFEAFLGKHFKWNTDVRDTWPTRYTFYMKYLCSVLRKIRGRFLRASYVKYWCWNLRKIFGTYFTYILCKWLVLSQYAKFRNMSYVYHT